MNALETRHTSRLHLTRIAAHDLGDLLRFYSDPQVTATLGGLRDAAWVASYLDRQIAHWDQHGFGIWTMHEAAKNRFVGRGGLRHAIIEDKTEIEVAYGLMSEFWGHGLATEIAIESVRVAFEELGMAEIVSFTLPTNLASRRVMEKAGFHYESDIFYAGLPHVLMRLHK
jgi:RimJ/RimL family protein N-acetyltransferase